MNSPQRVYSQPYTPYKKLNRDELKVLCNDNQQNYHIAVGYEHCNDILLALIKQGAVIESVHIGDSRPRITLLHKPPEGAFNSGTVVISPLGGNRAEEKHRVFINRCCIEWTQYAKQL